jgi:hypothetical protein
MNQNHLLKALFLAVAGIALAQAEEHEYAQITEHQIELHDLTFKSLDGSQLNLRQYAAGKRALIISFNAAWCKNSAYNAPALKRLYDKYKDRGLGMISIMEYSTVDEVRIFINRFGIDCPVAIETKSRDDREKSLHFKYRRLVGDNRKWGTPFHIIIDARHIESAPNTVLAKKVYIAAGELMEDQTDTFIQMLLKN